MEHYFWEVSDESMLYPSEHAPIPYFLLHREGSVPQAKFVLVCDAPSDVAELMRLQECAEREYCEITGMWARQIADPIDGGRIGFDVVFASELKDSRKP